MENKLIVIILVGLPGSGKSTLALSFLNYVKISQDKIGNRNDCIHAMRKSLADGKSVLIDRTNISKKQRKYFIDVAKEFGARVNCFFLDVSAMTCIERIKNRENHETLPASSGEAKITEVVMKFVDSLEIPLHNEDIDEITIINDGIYTVSYAELWK